MNYGNNGYVKTKYFNYYAMVVLYIILLLPFLSLSGVQNLMGETVFSAYQSAAMVILFLLYLFKVRYIPRDAFSMLYLVFNLLIFYSTTRNYGFSMGILVSIFAGFFIVLLIQQDGEMIIRALTFISVCVLAANLVSMLRVGGSASAEYFIGGKNSLSIFLAPATFVVMANAYIRRGRMTWHTVCYGALAAIMTFWAGSATGIVTAIAMLAGILWIRKFKPNVMILMVGMIVAQAVLVLLLDALSDSPLWVKVLGWLGKEETLTSRAMIWDQAFDIIADNWFIGVGRGVGIRYVTTWGRSQIAGEAHNFFLELFLEGGIVGFTLYMLLLWDALKNLNMDSMLHRVLFMCFIVLLVNGLAEAVNNKMMVNIALGLLNACSKNTLDNTIGKYNTARRYF